MVFLPTLLLSQLLVGLSADVSVGPVGVSKTLLKTSVLNSSDFQEMAIEVTPWGSSEPALVKIPYDRTTNAQSAAEKVCKQHTLLEGKTTATILAKCHFIKHFPLQNTARS
jgi:hypothetical protein